jgi:gamma-glutamyltranspeptidase/glutathione hydrolase
MQRTGLLLLILFSLLQIQCRLSPTRDDPPIGLITEEAMVVSAHPLATQVGVDILRQGGNAVDAMVAVHHALAVVYPAAGNIGGGGFMVARQQDGTLHTLDFREKAPLAADRDMYLDENGEVVPKLSWRGHLAAGVPGSVAGMQAAHDSLGRLPWRDLIQPAVDLAAKGFVLTKREARGLNGHLEALNEYSTQASNFTRKEKWAEGDSIFYPELALVMERIREQGRDGFYMGTTADLIVAEMERGKGIMTHEDLENYEAIWREPIVGDYRGFKIISMPPPSSGGIALLQLLEMVEPYPLSEYGRHSTEAVHLMVEAERRVYADRAQHLGDMDYYDVPLTGLIEADYLTQRMADFDPRQASDSDSISAGQPAPYESPQTTHYSIVDAEGNAVSVTTTINGGYGSCVVVGGAGFLLNNEMDDFSSKPGVPNAYGLLGAEANAIAPGKRMLSSMTPTIVEKNDSLYMVVGTPGGSTIITSVFQNILNVLDFGMGMQASVAAPRFHHQWKPEWVSCDSNAFESSIIQQLTAMGHTIKPGGTRGRVDAILILPDGRLEGGADPRGDDAAGGY